MKEPSKEAVREAAESELKQYISKAGYYIAAFGEVGREEGSAAVAVVFGIDGKGRVAVGLYDPEDEVTEYNLDELTDLAIETMADDGWFDEIEAPPDDSIPVRIFEIEYRTYVPAMKRGVFKTWIGSNNAWVERERNR